MEPTRRPRPVDADERRATAAAVAALARAEAVARLAAVVSGPADAPPTDAADIPAWVADWTRRAMAALQAAQRDVVRGAQEGVERARQVARDIADAARRLAGLPGAAWQAHRSVLTGVQRVAEGLMGATAAGFGTGLSFGVLGVLAFMAFMLRR